MESSTSASFDAYVLYLYIVLGHPAKEIAEHQGVSKEDVAEILRHYGFNFKNAYGAGQHFRAYPVGKSFRLKDGRTIQLEITQDFLESYVKSGSFYDNSFEDYINRYFTPEPKPPRSPKAAKEKPQKPVEPAEYVEPAEEEPVPKPEAKPRREIKLSPKLKTALKILACVIAAALIVLMASCAGCIKFREISCAGYSPNIGEGSDAAVFDLNFSAGEGVSAEITVLIDGASAGTVDLAASENAVFQIKGVTGTHTVETELDGEKSNPLSVDMDAANSIYIVVSMESDKLHISQTTD